MKPLETVASLFREKRMVTWIVQNTRVLLSMILKYYVNALCSHRRDISLYTISRHAITLKVLEHSKNVKEYPF